MKKVITFSLKKSINFYFSRIKPRFKKKKSLTKWKKLYWLLYWLICGQSCFISKIVENTPCFIAWQNNYEKWKKSKKLNKNAQIQKVSDYLSKWVLPITQALNWYLSYLAKDWFWWFINYQENISNFNFNNHVWIHISERVNNTIIISHDTTDIQKPYARKMENLCICRDWSNSNSKTWKCNTWKWYLAEVSVAWFQWRLHPLLVNLYSSKEKWYKSTGSETEKNIKILNNHGIWNKSWYVSVLDRWYDDSSFMLISINEHQIPFIIRWTSKRNVISQNEFHDIIKSGEANTKAYRENMFVKVENFIKHKMRYKFQKYSDIYPEYWNEDCSEYYKFNWFEVAHALVYLKHKDNDPKNKDSVVPVNLVAVRVIENSKNKDGEDVKWIDEDLLSNSFSNGKWERLIYFYTSLPVHSIDDAVYVLFVYLMRWYVETYIRYLKQIFELEKVCIMDFNKIKNLCKLLPITTHYLYEKYSDFEEIEIEKTTRTLRSIFERETGNTDEVINECIDQNKDRSNIRIIKKRDGKIILDEFLYFTYKHFLETKWLTSNPDSYAKFIKDLMGSSIEYTKHIIRYDIYDP